MDGCDSNSYDQNTYALAGNTNGAAGGDGTGYRASSGWASRYAGGGAGNPGGYSGINATGNVTDQKAENGTGGLLVIYATNINNDGKIESNGSKGISYGRAGGGSSGGGTINIFYTGTISQNGEIKATGGEDCGNGSKGGNGSVSIGSIATGTYLSDTGEAGIEDETVTLVQILNNDEVVGNNGQVENNLVEYNLKVYKPDTAKAVFESSDSSIVTVDNNGKVTLVKSGEVTITAKITTKIGEIYTDSCQVKAEKRLYLYYYGNKFEALTGGYTTCARTGRRFSATFNNDNIYIDCNTDYGGGGVYTSNKIDLTNYSKLKSYGKVTGWATSDSNGRQLATTDSNSWGSEYSPSSYLSFTGCGRTTEVMTMENDLSSIQGERYICNGFNQSYGEIYAIWLEK